MSEPPAFERVLASLYDAMLDETYWPATSALIDEAFGIAGNALMVGEGPQDDIRVTFVGLYYRGQRRPDLEREYLDVYHPINEGIPRLRQLPDGHLVPIKDLYTAEELHTSRAYNEALRRGQYQQVRRPLFSWTRIKGESDVQGGWENGSVEEREGTWIGTDGGSPEGDWSPCRRRGRPPVRSPSVGRCSWAACPGCPRSWCTSNPWGFRNRTTARGTSRRWS